jgi:hypothetical protein
MMNDTLFRTPCVPGNKKDFWQDIEFLFHGPEFIPHSILLELVTTLHSITTSICLTYALDTDIDNMSKGNIASNKIM